MTRKHTFTAEQLREKYFNQELIDQKLEKKGFELDEHMSVETNEDGSRTYRQFIAK